MTISSIRIGGFLLSKYLFWAFFLARPFIAVAQYEDSVWMRGHYLKRERYIPMRDGINLFTSIYMPVDSNDRRHPILLLRGPYSCSPYGQDWVAFYKSYFMSYLRKGYIIVFQDVRGRFESQGIFENIRPFNPKKRTSEDIDEASDAYDTIDWLIGHIAGNNGCVGALGTSIGGFYALMAGLSGHSALKAISPQAPVTNWFLGDDIHHNGALMLEETFDFFVMNGFGVPHEGTGTTGPGQIPIPGGDAYKFYLQKETLDSLSVIARSRGVAFWDTIMSHPDYDSWWRARNDLRYISRIPHNLPCLVVGGQFDAEDCYGALNVYHALVKAHKTVRLVYGPWRHGQWGSSTGGYNLGRIRFGGNTSEWFQQHEELPFFDRYLLNTRNEYTATGAAIFFTGDNVWHQFPKWPVANTSKTEFYLCRDKTLSLTTPLNARGMLTYVSDPATPVPYINSIQDHRTVEYMDDDQRFSSERPDVACFIGPVLTHAVTFAGPVAADLTVSISRSDADFIVKLIDVYPQDGNTDSALNSYQMLVRGDVFRGRYRHGFRRPEAFRPGKVTRVHYRMNDIAHTFVEGHRLMVQVQSTWFPLVDRNPQQFVNIYRAKAADFVPETITLYSNSRHRSRIILNSIHY